MGKFEEFSKQALESLGGSENLVRVTHCATRLRVSYKSKKVIDEEKMKNLPGCAGIVNKDRQVQFIIGPSVSDCYYEFLETAHWDPSNEPEAGTVAEEDDEGPHDLKYWMNRFGNFVAPIFMPIIPALVVGGLILAMKTLLVNYFGFSTDSGTAQLMLGIFQAGFYFLPVYIGYSYANQLKMPPVYGMFLGAVMICPLFVGGTVTDFLGIPIAQVSYYSSIIPIVLGVSFMYLVHKGVKRIVPEALTFFLTPLLTMIVTVPVTLVALGPLGSYLSGYIATFVVWLTSTLGFIAQPILAVIYPYMVMFGLDKAISPIGIQLIATMGYNSVTGVMGFVSNICIGATALAVAVSIKDDKAKKGLASSFGITALCGVTEPAFYGCLISRPSVLLGTAIGAASAGLFAGIMGLRTFIQGGCPGLLTFLLFLDPETGSFYYVIVAMVTAAIAIVVTFVATTLILRRDAKVASASEAEEKLAPSVESPAAAEL